MPDGVIHAEAHQLVDLGEGFETVIVVRGG
jgi:hypothetical protein